MLLMKSLGLVAVQGSCLVAAAAAAAAVAVAATAQVTTQSSYQSITSVANSTAPQSTSMSNETTRELRLPITSISLFLGPAGDPGPVGASVISAGDDLTAYEIKCLSKSGELTSSSCALAIPITITEGISTMIYSVYRAPRTTMGTSSTISTTPTPNVTPSSTTAFVNCDLFGGTRATQAGCTSHTVISGLGDATGTTTLASTQITYVPVTVTAGLEKLFSATAGDTPSTDGVAHKPVQTMAALYAAAGAAGMAIFGRF